MNQERRNRHYKSPLRERRALETRQRIVDTARRLFAQHGYSATTMGAIAEQAGVAVQTIYSQVGSKQELLLAILDRIEELAGVDAFIRELQDAQDAQAKIVLVTRFQRRLWEQGRDIVELAFGSAPLHADLAHLADLGNQRHKRGQGIVIREIEQTGELKSGLDVHRATAILTSATSFGVYRWMVDEFGWSGDEYETWLADTLRSLLLRS